MKHLFTQLSLDMTQGQRYGDAQLESNSLPMIK